MPVPVTRRHVILGSMFAMPAIVPALGMAGGSAASNAAAHLAALERKAGGRLGVAVLDAGSGARIEYRADERFAMCSTFKVLAAALVLSRVDRGSERLNRRIAFTEKDLVPWSPVTKEHAGSAGMTLAELCEAALAFSDNTAGNLLLGSFGGPSGLTAYVRSLGDGVTRLDRMETDLNEARPGDSRDTTTPAAMAGNLRRILLGDALSALSREQLTAWMIANKTGDKRLRTGLPNTWRVGDKTGTGSNGAANDIAIVWPPDRAPIIIAAYSAEAPASGDARNAVLAEVGRIVATSVSS